MTNLWKHQVAALEFMNNRLKDANGYAALFMGVATGKTRTTLEFIRQRRLKSVLVLSVKEACRDAWLRQTPLYAPEYVAVDLTSGTIQERAKALSAITDLPTIYVMNYDIISREPMKSQLLKKKFHLIVSDEAQKLKSPTGAQSVQAARLAYQTPYRLALTGTPLHNTPLDIYGIARFLSPYKHQRGFGSTVFGTWTAFRSKYAAWTGPNNYILMYYRNQEELAAKISDFAFQVRREDVLDLPSVQHMTQYVELEPEVYRAYKELEKEYVTYIQDESVTVDNALVKGLRLQQITGGYVQLDNGQKTPISAAKARETERLLVEEIDPDQPVVIFYKFNTDLDMIVSAVRASGRSYGFLNGKSHQLQEWQSAKFNTLIVQVQAGSMGVDLTRAHYAIIYSLGWSLGDYDQLQGRLERTTQKYPVVYFHVVADRTIDRMLYKSLDSKGEAVKMIIQELKNTYGV